MQPDDPVSVPTLSKPSFQQLLQVNQRPGRPWSGKREASQGSPSLFLPLLPPRYLPRPPPAPSDTANNDRAPAIHRPPTSSLSCQLGRHAVLSRSPFADRVRPFLLLGSGGGQARLWHGRPPPRHSKNMPPKPLSPLWSPATTRPTAPSSLPLLLFLEDGRPPWPGGASASPT